MHAIAACFCRPQAAPERSTLRSGRFQRNRLSAAGKQLVSTGDQPAAARLRLRSTSQTGLSPALAPYQGGVGAGDLFL